MSRKPPVLRPQVATLARFTDGGHILFWILSLYGTLVSSIEQPMSQPDCRVSTSAFKKHLTTSLGLKRSSKKKSKLYHIMNLGFLWCHGEIF